LTLENNYSKKIDLLVDALRLHKQKTVDRLLRQFRLKKLRNKNFSVICNNCTAGMGIYQKLGLRYTTPTIGLFFYSDDYIKFLEDFEKNIKLPIEFKKTSKHPEVNVVIKKHPYPIGVLGNDIEVQFNHYANEAEAAEKWARRSERINFNNLFFMYSDRHNFEEDFLKRYEKLPFKHKIFFSSKPRDYPGLVVFVREFENESEVGGSAIRREYEKYFDVIKWLNEDGDSIIEKKLVQAKIFS
jgi:uncharacterized protein (DUF1919 family)